MSGAVEFPFSPRVSALNSSRVFTGQSSGSSGKKPLQGVWDPCGSCARCLLEGDATRVTLAGPQV